MDLFSVDKSTKNVWPSWVNAQIRSLYQNGLLKYVGRDDSLSEHLGPQYNDTHAQHAQRSQEWGLP